MKKKTEDYTPVRYAARISLIYLFFSVLWIFYSDNLVYSLNIPDSTKSFISMIKGWVFVVTTTLIIFLLLKKSLGHHSPPATGIPLHNKESIQNGKRGSARRDWFDPFIIIALFIMIFGLFLWMFYLDSVKKSETELENDSVSAKEIIHQRLAGNEEYLKLLARERANGFLTVDDFQRRTARYISDHKEFINITWVDSDFLIRTASPLEHNDQIIGLKINLPEPKRATAYAQKTKLPVYTYPFESIQGNPSFEIWVPVFNRGEFLGFLGGVYSCEKLMEVVLPKKLAEQNYLSLYNKQGGLLGYTGSTDKVGGNLNRIIPLEFLGNGLYLRLDKYGNGFLNWGIILLGALSIGLMIALSYNLRLLRNDISERVRTESDLRSSENKFRLLFETMAQGVVYQDAGGKIIHANTAAQKILGLSPEQILGRTLTDPGWMIIHEDGSSFPEKNHPVALALNDGVEINDVVMGFFNPKMEEYRWLLINATPQFRDGERNPYQVFTSFNDITERKNAEMELKKSEERFRSTLDSMLEGCQIIGFDWRYIYLNDAADRHNRRPKKELLGHKYMEMWPGIEYTEVFATCRDCMEKRIPYHLENEFVFPDGSIGWFDLNIQPVPEGIFILSIDISERKKAEAELLMSEKKYRYLFEYNPQPMWIYDTNSLAFLEVNTSAVSRYGYSREEFEKMTLKEIRPADDIPSLIDDVYKTTNEFNNAGIWRHKKKNGEIIFVEIISHSINYEGKPARLVLASDVTEQKRAKEEIVNLNNCLNQLIVSIQELSSAHDIETVQHIVASSARKLTGADGAAFVLREGDLSFYADEDALNPLWKGARFPIKECISGWVMLNRKPAIINDIYTDERVPVDIYKPTFVKSMAMVPVNTKEPLAAIGIYWSSIHNPSDIEIKLLQTLADAASRAIENVRLYEELEKRVILRTAQLETANKELEAFSYSVSHDLRAPLRGIDGFSQALLEDYQNLLDDKGKNYLFRIRSGAQKMESLIDDLLNLARITRKSLKPERVDLSEIVRTIASELQENDPLRRVEFKIAGNLTDNADPKLIRIALQNLIENSWKFTSKKSETLIEFGIMENDGQRVYFIRDNGAGFKMEYVNKLFTPFQRLHHSNDFSGTGIGLATIQKIIHRHSGTIWAEGETDKGATFYFTLNN